MKTPKLRFHDTEAVESRGWYCSNGGSWEFCKPGIDALFGDMTGQVFRLILSKKKIEGGRKIRIKVNEDYYEDDRIKVGRNWVEPPCVPKRVHKKYKNCKFIWVKLKKVGSGNDSDSQRDDENGDGTCIGPNATGCTCQCPDRA